jgi:hypothetical protein
MPFDHLRRREFLGVLGGAAAAWPLAARAQQGDRMRRIGVLLNRGADNSDGPSRFAAFQQGWDHRPPGNPSRRSFSRRKQAMTVVTNIAGLNERRRAS